MRSSRKIGIVSWDFDPPKGGLGRTLIHMAEVLRKQGYDVRTLTPSGGTDVIGGWTKRGGFHLAFSAVLFFCLHRWIRHTKREIVCFPCGPGGVWLLKKPKACTTVAIVYHTYTQQIRLVPGQWWKRAFLPLERISLRKADAIFCYATDTRDVLVHAYGCKPDCVHLLPQLLDLHPWLVAQGEKEPGLCVCVARMEQRKGIRFLAVLWPHVKKLCPSAVPIVVGEGIQEGRIDRLVAQEHLSVQRIPSLPLRDLIALVRRAELVLCPSYLEGFGLTALEAMAAGTPLLASGTDGLRSLIRHGETGFLLPVADLPAWLHAVQELLSHPEEGTRVAAAARTEVQRRFAAEASIRALQELLEAL